MSDIPAFMVANFSIQDATEYRKYEKGFFPILKRHGGSFFTFDDNPVTFEGANSLKGRVVIFRFPSEIQATAWYNDPEYQELSKFRREGAPLRSLSLIKGLPPRK